MTVEEIAARLVTQAKRVSVAEADTCGLVGHLLSTVPGSSHFFQWRHCLYGGLKQSILGVSDELYKTKGSVSPEMAIAMARSVRHLTGTDFMGLLSRALAGPTGGRSGLPIGPFILDSQGRMILKWRNGFMPMRVTATAINARQPRRYSICWVTI